MSAEDHPLSSYFDQSSTSIFDSLSPAPVGSGNADQVNESFNQYIGPAQMSGVLDQQEPLSAELQFEASGNLLSTPDQFSKADQVQPSVPHTWYGPPNEMSVGLINEIPVGVVAVNMFASEDPEISDDENTNVINNVVSPILPHTSSLPPIPSFSDTVSTNIQFPASGPRATQQWLIPQAAKTGFSPGLTAQSAMMSSMSTSMFMGEFSPNSSLDVEGASVKFSQASLRDRIHTQSQSSPRTPQGTDIRPPQFASTPLPAASSIHGSEAPGSVNQCAENVSSEPLSNYFSAAETVQPQEKHQQHFLGKDSMTSKPCEILLGSEHTSTMAMFNPAFLSPSDNFSGALGEASNTLAPDVFLTPTTEHDIFTASLLSSASDRRHDAWLPCPATKRALNALATGPPGSFFPDKDMLTLPGIAVKEDFGDPVKNLVHNFLGKEEASKRIAPTQTSVTQDDRGLRQLVASGCYHAAVNLTTLLLTVYGQGEGRAGQPSKHTAHSVQLWFTRLSVLVKLRRFSLAEVECQPFGQLDTPDLYFEFYPELYGGRKGSMVPFSFRLLVACLPQYLGKHIEALDRLNLIIRICEQILNNLKNNLSEEGNAIEWANNVRDNSLKLWNQRRIRVLYMSTEVAVGMKDFRLAGGLLDRLMREDPNSIGGLYSALGRLCLQLGDVFTAQQVFNQHLEHCSPPPNHNPIQGLLHSSYIAIAQNAFREATEILQQAHKIDPTNGLVVNNLAVCLMYLGRVQEAISQLEGAIFSQPNKFLHEALVVNLATMYELESSSAHQKKLALLNLVSKYKGDCFNVAALKLQQ